MRRLIILNCLSLVVILTLAGNLKSQQAATVEDWSINVPSSPLTIEVNHSVMVRNISKYNVISFKIGCVSQKDKKFYKVADGRNINDTFAAATDSGYSFLLMSVFRFEDEEKKVCLKSKSKMGIIEVIFEDGGMWNLTPLKTNPTN